MKKSFRERFMNKKVKAFGLVLAMAAFALAQEPAAPAAQPAENAAPAVAAEAPAEPAVAQNAAPAAAAPAETVEAEQAPVAEPAAEPAPAAEPVAETAEPVAEPEQYGDMPAPMAVRGVDASSVPYNEEPIAEPKAVRGKESPRATTEPVPMRFTFGAQAFLGTNTLYANDWDFDESYSGIAWKAGLFAIFPLNAYMMGFKIGVLYDHSDASATYIYSSDYTKEMNVKFKMDRISVPFLFTLKSPYSSFTLDFGAQVSIPVQDNFKYSYEYSADSTIKRSADMIDLDYRSSVDFALVLGLTIKANRYMSFDIRYECGFSNFYEDVPLVWRLNELTSSTLLLGLSFYAF